MCRCCIFPPISCYDPIGKVSTWEESLGRSSKCNVSQHIFSALPRALTRSRRVQSLCGEAEVEKSSTLSDSRYITTARAGEMTQRKLKFHLFPSSSSMPPEDRRGQTSIFIPKNKLLDHERPRLAVVSFSLCAVLLLLLQRDMCGEELKITLECLDIWESIIQLIYIHETRDHEALNHRRVEWNFSISFWLDLFSSLMCIQTVNHGAISD